MPALGFTDQRARLRRILENALAGAFYDSSEREADGRVLVLHAHRSTGKPVTVSFRGVSSSDASAEPEPGVPIRLTSVDVRDSGCLSAVVGLVAIVLPRLRSPVAGSARVRIEAGAARLDIVCQDADWWEDEAPRA